MEIYKSLISQIGELLNNEGFFKKGNTFYINKNNNWGILDFQKSKSSTLTEVLFTINMGVSSKRLRIFHNEDLKQKPEIEKSHWRKRIGFLMFEKKDYWWKINNHTILDKLTAEISTILTNIVLPELSKHITDESLKMEWLSGISEGLTDLQRYVFLTSLLKLDGNDKLQLYIEELEIFSKGKPFEEVAREHILRLD